MKKYQKKKAEDQTGNDASDQNSVSGHQQGKHFYSNFFKKQLLQIGSFAHTDLKEGKA